MRGLPTLVTYGRAQRQVEVIGEVSQQHRRATMATLKLAFVSSAALELLASISVAIVAVSVGIRLTHGSMTLQAGLLAILLAPEAYWPVRRVGAEFHAAADSAEAIDGILAELDSEWRTGLPGRGADCSARAAGAQQPAALRRPRSREQQRWLRRSLRPVDVPATTHTRRAWMPFSPGSRWMPVRA